MTLTPKLLGYCKWGLLGWVAGIGLTWTPVPHIIGVLCILVGAASTAALWFSKHPDTVAGPKTTGGGGSQAPKAQ